LTADLFLKNLAALLKNNVIYSFKTVAADTFGFPIKHAWMATRPGADSLCFVVVAAGKAATWTAKAPGSF
jgi:hypothetical protein